MSPTILGLAFAIQVASADTLLVRATAPGLRSLGPEKVWTLERGEYDEPYVVRYRVEGLR